MRLKEKRSVFLFFVRRQPTHVLSTKSVSTDRDQIWGVWVWAVKEKSARYSYVSYL
jgi:hypothetical protein